MRVKLFDHQERAVVFALERKAVAGLFLDLGLGKTITTLALFEKLREKDTSLRMLVVCPLSLVNKAWRDDTEKATDYVCRYWKDKDSEKADIVTINYESFITKRGFQYVVDFLKKGPVIGVIDESSALKNHKSKRTEKLMLLAEKFKYRLLLSGCPDPNSELEYWGQINFLKPGLLHWSFYAFRNTYFHLERRGQVAEPGKLGAVQLAEMFKKGWHYSILPVKRKSLIDRIAPICIWMKKEDCLDLPEQVDVVREITLNEKEKHVYTMMKRHLIAEIKGQHVTASIALAKIMKLRQITSGFAIAEGEQPIEIGSSSKLAELKLVMDEIGHRPVIIWANFRHEIRMIRDMLSSNGEQIALLYGEITEKDENIEAFQTGKARILIANPKSAAHGLTFTLCDTQIFYSLDYSFESYFQARGRTHRIGQKNACVYIHLLAKNTIDEILYKTISQKGSRQELMEALARDYAEAQSFEYA